jgi:hypothetical protein
MVFWEWEKSLSDSSDAGAAAPAGAATPPWRVSGTPTHLFPPRAGGNPRLVRATVSSHPFLKVLLGTRSSGVLGLWWDNSGGRSGGGSSAFSRATVVGICFSFVLLYFLLGLMCCSPQRLYRVVMVAL